MPAKCCAGARDRSTGYRRGEVGVEEHEGDPFDSLLDRLDGGGLQHSVVLCFARPCTTTCGKPRRGKGELVEGRDGRGNSRGTLSPPFCPASWHQGEPHGRGTAGAGRGRRVSLERRVSWMNATYGGPVAEGPRSLNGPPRSQEVHHVAGATKFPMSALGLRRRRRCPF
jgi:hypothetical protein